MLNPFEGFAYSGKRVAQASTVGRSHATQLQASHAASVQGEASTPLPSTDNTPLPDQAANPAGPQQLQCCTPATLLSGLQSPSASQPAGKLCADRKRKAGACSSNAKLPKVATSPPKGVPEKLGSRPLRLIIIGHNPSEHAWHSGHYYSNPSNRMWPILIKTGIAPPGTTGPEADDSMPASAGVGFTDVGTGTPGTNSADFKSEVFIKWRQDLYCRLKRHMDTACKGIGCTCGKCGAPVVVAFSGKRHYLELMNVGRSGAQRVKTVEVGPQAVKPPGWPLPASTQVWVMTSTSGASALSNEQREAPWWALSALLRSIPWPRHIQPSCQMHGSEQAVT